MRWMLLMSIGLSLLLTACVDPIEQARVAYYDETSKQTLRFEQQAHHSAPQRQYYATKFTENHTPPTKEEHS